MTIMRAVATTSAVATVADAITGDHIGRDNRRSGQGDYRR